MRSVIIMISFLFFLYGCGSDDCSQNSDIKKEPISINVVRLEEALFKAKSTNEMLMLLSTNPNFSQFFLHADQYPNDTLLAEKLFTLLQNPSIDTLYQESTAAYKNFDGIRNDLEMAFGKLKTLYPETKTPVVQTVVTGLYNDLFISDSSIIVGIDFFIGKDASYTPQNVPGYILSRYNPSHLASIIVKYLSGQHVVRGDKVTLLSEMIDFGKTYYLASRLVPCTPDSIWLGYTPDDMKQIYDNESIIWANFVENEVLYETSHIIKRKFLGERPNVYEISQKCPGRIGAWVGWRIVEDYMRKNQSSIPDLLNERDNEKIFRLSGYKPQSH